MSTNDRYKLNKAIIQNSDNVAWKILSVLFALPQGMSVKTREFFKNSMGSIYYENPEMAEATIDTLIGWLAGNAILGTADLLPKGGSNPNINADIRKFTEYIFKDGAAPGKDVVYKNLGYSIDDSKKLINIYKEQAAIKYANGEYTLGKADSFGQRINIEIELPGIGGAAGKTSYLKSGWMIKPDGSLSLNTPFSGFTR